MAEFLISMTMVMSVLLLAIVMLGKFNDVRNRTLMGSRYVAWERTVWTDGDARKTSPRSVHHRRLVQHLRQRRVEPQARRMTNSKTK